MKVKRIVSNTVTPDLKKAAAFYGDILGLELIMDHGWFQTYGSDAKMTVQASFGTEGGSGTAVPDLSIEVDDLEAALARFKNANVPIEYGPASEPWGEVIKDSGHWVVDEQPQAVAELIERHASNPERFENRHESK
jgi:catechol 2,3-dioxygenase-like lactoylglutathione lyase family enzyme